MRSTGRLSLCEIAYRSGERGDYRVIEIPTDAAGYNNEKSGSNYPFSKLTNMFNEGHTPIRCTLGRHKLRVSVGLLLFILVEFFNFTLEDSERAT
jgi:hypothetical protein